MKLETAAKGAVLAAIGSAELGGCVGVVKIVYGRRAIPMLVSSEINLTLRGVASPLCSNLP